MATITGEVLGERTVLGFPRKSANPGAGHVMRHHTGRTDHATGYQTQLQFTLRPPTTKHTLSTNVNHPPRPPPVVIERLSPRHMNIHDRMEMAALLARRDFRNGCIPAEFLSAEQSEDDSSSEESEEASEVREEQIIPMQPKAVQVVETVQSKVPPILSEESHSHIKLQEKDSEIDKMASEVVSLRRQLRRQVSRLREAVCARKSNKGSVENEEDVDAEKELRREDGRSVRNMQSLYALQQQVQKLKCELEKHQKVPTTVRDTKKSLAMKQLAATHRSAIRLLHSFAGLPGRPVVYRQLSELIQQLTLCCCQLGLDGAQLLELNDQMKALENDIAELDKDEEELVTATRLRQAQPPRKPVKLHPQRQQWHRNLTLVQPHRSSGHFKAQTFSSLMRKRTPPARPKTKLPSSQKHKRRNIPTQVPPSSNQRYPSTVKKAVKLAEARQPTSRTQKPKQKRKGLVKKRNKQSHSDTYNKENGTHKEALQSNNESKRDFPNVSDEGNFQDSESSNEDVIALVNNGTMKDQLLSASTPISAPTEPSSVNPDNNSSSKVPLIGDEGGTAENLEMLQVLQEMLVKISRIEEEKMKIQQRWSHLTYHDPTVTPRLVIHTSSPPPCSATTLSVSPSVLQSLSHYRDRFQHHLKLKSAITGLDWHSSQLIDKMSEEIIDEIIDSTVNELDDFCEQYVHNVFASEFAVPNTNI